MDVFTRCWRYSDVTRWLAGCRVPVYVSVVTVALLVRFVTGYVCSVTFALLYVCFVGLPFRCCWFRFMVSRCSLFTDVVIVLLRYTLLLFVVGSVVCGDVTPHVSLLLLPLLLDFVVVGVCCWSLFVVWRGCWTYVC